MTITWIDAGVLITIVRGDQLRAGHDLAILRDPGRTFVASAFLRLELLPKALYHRNHSEVAFYEKFFTQVSDWAKPIEDVVAMAEREVAQHGLNALDALHVAAAILLGADEFVTIEGANKPLHRVTRIKVVSI